jgi:hypothetical protein
VQLTPKNPLQRAGETAKLFFAHPQPNNSQMANPAIEPKTAQQEKANKLQLSATRNILNVFMISSEIEIISEENVSSNDKTFHTKFSANGNIYMIVVNKGGLFDIYEQTEKGSFMPIHNYF